MRWHHVIIRTQSMHAIDQMHRCVPSPAEALRIAILFNDKYAIDGRDPNGYVGCMWSICGIHDMGWTERPIFGKIRFMNYAGCMRKFGVHEFVARYPPAKSNCIKAGGTPAPSAPPPDAPLPST